MRAGTAEPHARRLERRLATLTKTQRGVVSSAQLRAIGFSRNMVAHRLGIGRLIRLSQGLFALAGVTMTARSRQWAALLTIGADAVISHLSALGLMRVRPDPMVVDVTCRRAFHRRDGIRLHRASLDPDEITVIDGVRVTTPSRTLFDVGTMLGAKAHARVANEALMQGLCELADLHAAHDRHAGRPGSVAFRRLLKALDPEGRHHRSPLEIRLNRFLRARRVPPWESNARITVGGDVFEPDVLWRAERVIVEADGRDPHLAPLTFASDRRRDRRMRVEGWEPIRVTSLDLDEQPDELERDLRTLLGLASG